MKKSTEKNIVNNSKDRFSKSFIKRYSFISIILVGILLLSACGSNNITISTDLDGIKERGYIVMGLDDTFAPMGFRDGSGELVGFDVDLAREVFNRAGLEVEFQPIDWSMKETELNSGNIDLIWNGYSITEERKEKVSFTQPYLENKQITITLANSDIKVKENLKNKKVAVQNGSSTLDAIMKYPDIVSEFDSGEPVLFDTNNEAFMDLEAKRSDAVVADEVLARYYVKQRGEEKYKVLEDDFGKEEYGIGVRKSDTELLKLLNDILDEMKADGSYDEVYSKWFSEN